MKRLLAAVAVLALATAARAEDSSPEAPSLESPRWGSFEIRLSGYHPKIDSEFAGSFTPYQNSFGDKRGWMGKLGVSKELYHGIGTLEAGAAAGYWEMYGHGHLTKDPTVAADSTALKVIPLSLMLTYRFDWVAEQIGVPLAPYGRVSLDRMQWWVTDGSGGSSKSGATNGYSLTGGVALMLDFFDRSLAREMDRDTGINHTYAFVDFTKSFIDDFGSKSSWDMSDSATTLTAGLLFVF
ncbi:MXAN_2562 family outer membrane beta-barrel protein [Anaeromyxobacter paludicola]|uniref:Outer membrane protein beta-barrel domain-containing protein n=1 Tax=Anaeromyxobacter paludicola TaxID=2918171 RepID=A0ABN6N9U1_9BACT|nr:MXAN_2562 family outer membrane beta-barrel protein [Anaeromyxobacter paludicola]BDG08879.1 hypothetical protein AMPC_19920 [Anaeromyxobacter paludicola]